MWGAEQALSATHWAWQCHANCPPRCAGQGCCVVRLGRRCSSVGFCALRLHLLSCALALAAVALRSTLRSRCKRVIVRCCAINSEHGAKTRRCPPTLHTLASTSQPRSFGTRIHKGPVHSRPVRQTRPSAGETFRVVGVGAWRAPTPRTQQRPVHDSEDRHASRQSQASGPAASHAACGFLPWQRASQETGLGEPKASESVACVDGICCIISTG